MNSNILLIWRALIELKSATWAHVAQEGRKDFIPFSHVSEHDCIWQMLTGSQLASLLGVSATPTTPGRHQTRLDDHMLGLIASPSRNSSSSSSRKTLTRCDVWYDIHRILLIYGICMIMSSGERNMFCSWHTCSRSFYVAASAVCITFPDHLRSSLTRLNHVVHHFTPPNLLAYLN